MTSELNQFLPYNDKLEARKLSAIESVVIHCTELPNITVAREYGEKVIYQSGTGNSGHYYITKSGDVYQWVSDNRVAHHVKGHNQNTIGIELDNLGRYPYWHKTNHQIMTDSYADAQINALIILLHKLSETLPNLKYICGHEELDRRLIPSENDPDIYIRRKMDPGALFPWDKVLAQISLQHRLENCEKKS